MSHGSGLPSSFIYYDWKRIALLVLIVLVGAVVVTALVEYLTPDRHRLRIAMPGGVSHEKIAHILIRHAESSDVELTPVLANGKTPLEMVCEGQADLCFVSGVAPVHSEAEEVTVMDREVLHVLARPERAAQGAEGLRGARVNIGPERADWRSSVQALLNFSGLRSGEDYAPTTFNANELMAMENAELPDVVMTVGDDCPPEVARLVRECGFVPMEVHFLEALDRIEAQYGMTMLPPAVYSTMPSVPETPVRALTVDLRLVASPRASEEAICRLALSIYDGKFAFVAGFEPLDEDKLRDDRLMRLHAGTMAFLGRNEPWLTGEMLMETEELRNLAGAVVVGVLLVWRWFKRRRNQIVMKSVHELHHLEREALRLENAERAGENHAKELVDLRRRFGHLKHQLVDQVVSHDRFEDPFLTELMEHIDSIRHSLLEVTAHRQHLWPTIEESGVVERPGAVKRPSGNGGNGKSESGIQRPATVG